MVQVDLGVPAGCTSLLFSFQKCGLVSLSNFPSASQLSGSRSQGVQDEMPWEDLSVCSDSS